MFKHSPHLTVTAADVDHAKKIIGLTPADETLIHSLQPVIDPHGKDIVDRFYDGLTEFEHLRKIILENTTITRLKDTFLSYFREMFSGPYNINYYRRRLQIGLTHARVGLELNWYLSFISRMKDEVFASLATHYTSLSSTQGLVLSRALGRLFAFDQALATQAYHLFVKQTLERQLAEANSGRIAKINFLASMSHELRTPLNSILGFSELMLEQHLIQNDVGEKYLQTIKRNGLSLLTLIDDILELAKANSGKMRLHIETFAIDGLMEDIELSLRSLIVQKTIDVRVNWPKGLELRTDYGKLKRILLNLISNAFKFTASGYIAVAAEEHENSVEFIVSDSGQGIAADELTTIFQEFVQGKPPTGQRSQGAGLGLAICKNLSELMRGSITAQSKIGEGSIFTVSVAKVLDIPQHVS